VVQLLREIINTEIEPLKNVAQKGFWAINRDIIDAEKQLRTKFE